MYDICMGRYPPDHDDCNMIYYITRIGRDPIRIALMTVSQHVALYFFS